MPDPTTPLLVPIPVQALLVNQPVINGVVFERWTNDYASLNQFLDPVPAPFQNIQPPAPGVHLHWKLPAALTHGTADSGSTDVSFPYTPNRWLVLRLATTASASSAQQMSAWVIQSDYLNPADGTTPFANPFTSTPTSVQQTLLGKSWTLQEWQGEPGGPLFLKATGTADMMFTAFQPGLINVYSFFDDTTTLPDNTTLTYLVAGWFSDPAHDPLAQFTPQQLNWTVLGGASVPDVSVFHGLVYDLLWQTDTIPPRADANADAMQVAVGYSAIDALAAIVGVLATGGSGSELEQKLEAFQYNFLQTLNDADGTAQLELLIRQAWFGTTPGGTIWEIVPIAQGQSTTAPLQQAPIPAPPPLTTDQQVWLAALNTTQNQLDGEMRELISMQWDLFALWWKSQRAPYVVGTQRQYYVDVNAIAAAITAALDPKQSNSYISEVIRQQQSVANLQTQLPDPTSQTSIAAWSQKIPANSGTLTLKPRALPAFYHPADPVLLVAGITPPDNEVDNSQPLPCRLVSATVTGVNVAINGATQAVSASSGSLGSIIQIPSSQNLPVVISTAITALAVETFFVDTNDAASIVNNGLNSNDPTAIAALQTAMAAGTAQISTIQNPLQASFAFADWQQAWSPLYLEWQITWLPGVTNAPSGPLEPAEDAQWPHDQDNGMQDNWSFTPGDWAFDGSDLVSQRGSEYYEWTAGDVWTAATPVQPQTYTGRTFLTPQTTYLLLARLQEYLKLHPDHDLQEVQTLLDTIGETRFLSQALSGFNDAFIMRSQQHTVPPAPGTPIANAIGAEYRGVPFVSMGDEDLSFGGGAAFFFPLRGGFFQFERLHLVDAFGQVLDLLQANGNNTGLAQNFFPIAGAGLVPDPNSGIDTPQRRLKQAPRIPQPSRLDLRLLDAFDDQKWIDLSAGTNPVCGWFLPNHLDQALDVYDAAGNPLGELLVLMNTSGEQTVTWLPAPDSPTPITNPAQIANPHLSAALVAFTAASGGIQPLSARPNAFAALLAAIDETLWTIEPLGANGDQDLAVLIGRPLALVRAQVQFELFGRPASNQSWRDTLQWLDADLTTFKYPIRLGSSELYDDGLIGYFSGDDYTVFDAVHPGKVSAPYVDPIVPGNYLELPASYPTYVAQNLTLLLDPRGSVHATSGILPVATISLPAQFYEAALQQMAVTFRIGPLLSDPAAIRVPFPAERRGVWSWISRTNPSASGWEVDPIIAANQIPRLNDAPPHLIDGWLQFKPNDIEGNKQ